MAFFDIISSIISGVIGPVTTAITAVANKKADVSLEKYRIDGTVDQSLITSDIALMGAQKSLLMAGIAYRGVRFMQYVFVYPLGLWWSAIIFDSIFHEFFKYSYRVEALPPPLNTWAGWMVAYLFLHSSVMQVLKR